MPQSFQVMDAIKVAYAAYFLAICVFFIWFALRVAKKGKASRTFNAFFVTWMIILGVVGIGYHLSSPKWAPWEDLLYGSHTPEKIYNITVQDHRFSVTSDNPIVVKQGELVRFDLTSNDLVYGFGLFSPEERMLFQMQVDPSSQNNLLWRFDEPGTYSIRSTEYSGPGSYDPKTKENFLFVKNAVIVVP